MRFLFTGIRYALTLRLKSPKGWAILLLLPLLVFAARQALPVQEISSPVQVGVALPERGVEDFWSLLEARNDTVLTFHAADEETITRNIAAGRWDCGLIVPEDFAQRLEGNDTDRLFTLRIGSGSAVYPLVQETVAACVAQLVSPNIAGEYLLDSGIVENEEALFLIQSRLEETQSPSQRAEVSLITADGSALAPPELADAGVDALLQWLICAALMVWMLLCAADLTRWSSLPAVRRLRPVLPATLLLLSRIGADGILALIAGFISMLLLGAGLSGCGAVLGYVLFWMTISVCLARFPSAGTVLPLYMPFAVVISLLMSGALVDISRLFPFLSGICPWFPERLFLRICTGQWQGFAYLLAAAGLLLGLSTLIDKMRSLRE